MKRSLKIKILSLMCCLSVGSNQTKAQITGPLPPQFANGNFELPEANSCINGVPRWNMVSMSALGSPLLVSTGSGQWLDMAGCNSDNGKYIEQRVSTVPGKLYYIQLDLGTNQNVLLGSTVNFWDAGVDVYINGVALNAGSNRLYHEDFGPSPKWKTLNTCMFRASGSITTVKIAGNGAIRSGISLPAPSPGKRVMSLDNVILKKADTISKLSQTSGGDCNRYCFRLESPFFSTAEVYPRITATRWYVGSSLIKSNDSLFCYSFPETGTHEVMVVFDLKDKCGITYTDTLKRTVISEPVETYADSFVYNLLCGEDSARLPWSCGTTGYFQITTETGIEVLLLPLPVTGLLPGLAPGNYVFTCINWDASTGCRKRIHRKVIIKPNTAPPIVYEDTDIVLDLPCGDTALHFLPFCSDPRLTHFKISGNGFINGRLGTEDTGIVSDTGGYLLLGQGYHGGDGVYRFSCYDEHKCMFITRLVIVKKLKESSCDIGLVAPEYCDRLNDPGYIRANLESCPDCRETFDHASWEGPWKAPSFVDYRSESYRILSREYIDSANCKKCTVTFWLEWGSAMSSFKYISTGGEDCIRIYDADLLRCLQGKTLKMYHYKDPSVRGDSAALSDEEFTVDPSRGIELCISKSRDYYLYSQEDPCCFMFIRIGKRDRVGGVLGKYAGTTAEDGSSGDGLQTADLKLLPNPASSVFRIGSSKGDEQYQRIDILDMNGRRLITRLAADAQTMIDMAPYNEGIYMVKVTRSNGQVLNLKLVHKKG